MQQLHEKFLKELPETMLDLPSQNFSLKDMEGKTVQLSDYLGKTVILDFWATWCGPCKRSFPAMQMAVNKYATDKDVVFLFIDTWERTPDADQQVKKFISANNYSFRVLLDRKPAVSGDNMVVEKYGITGIPTKFVIDPNGKIRFRLTGFGGGNDAAVEEISAMIELARKG
ncbi:TlpA family protein disulfide reductase [Arachidicoccus terrestris]|nr:TlpA family protein disulfide reductase [Arachidicoccus terrestris]